jgi:TonB family protein
MRRQKPEFGVLDREQLHGYLQMGLLSQRDLQDEELALWVSQKIGANFVVFGSVTRSSKGITLHVRVVRSSDGLEITKAKADIPLDSNLQDLLAKPLPLPDYVVSAEPAPERLAVLCGNAERGGETNDLFASAGVSMPRCAHCPDPPYTEEVRKNRVQGSVTMHVVIGTDGRPISIRIVKGAPNGLNHLATEAVRKWWFEPATKDGKPVSVCTPVEITFRLF